MDRETAVVALAALIMGGLVLTVLITSVTRLILRRRQGAAALDEGAAVRLEERMMRMEQAIDAVAVEIERISEGQRYTTKLLSERGGDSSGRAQRLGIPR